MAILHTKQELLDSCCYLHECYDEHNHDAGIIEFLYKEVDGRQWIAVKGTSPNPGKLGFLAKVGDMTTNFRFFPGYDKKFGIGWMPRGFLKVAEDFAYYITDENNAIDTERPITFCGHSLGAAVLLIAAPVLEHYAVNIESIISLGSPNVGDIKSMPKGVPVTCLRNGKDVVTKLPPFYGDAYPTAKIGKRRGWILDHQLVSYEKSIRELTRD